jgi:hypoxanthine phosphoribosyltransferase
VDTSGTLGEFFQAMLPDKAEFHAGWVSELAAPSVCVTALDDVRRLDLEDINALPVPPLVKGVFRKLLLHEQEKSEAQQAILQSTDARKRAFFAPLRDRKMQPPTAGSKFFQDTKRYRLIVAREEIEAGVRIIAHKIESWAKGERVVLVGILKGAFMLMSDLCRTLVRPYSVSFVEASSYKDDQTQGDVSIVGEFSRSKFFDPIGKVPHKIVLVDELVDNGKTMHDMKQYFLKQLADSHTETDILTVCLFSKKRDRKYPDADITGIMNLPDLWLVGYGLDDRGTKRGWTELFAMPKVTMVETNEKDEVDKLLAVLDDDAILMSPHDFAGIELSHSHKARHRVCGLDTQGSHARPNLEVPNTSRVTSKAELESILATIPTVKGKYEQDLHFSFFHNTLALVVEDEIFYGNNQVYAELRCSIRNNLEVSARRFGLQGPGPVLGS